MCCNAPGWIFKLLRKDVQIQRIDGKIAAQEVFIYSCESSFRIASAALIFLRSALREVKAKAFINKLCGGKSGEYLAAERRVSSL